MKRIITLFLTVLVAGVGTTLLAQGKYGADSANCIKYLSYYQEYYKQKNYNDATPNWRKAYKACPPTANQNMLINGTAIVRRLISQNAKNAIYKEKLVDTLLTIHDQRAEYYPKYAVTALNNKGLDLINYVKGDDQKLYDGLSDIIEKNGVNTKPSIYLFNLNAAVELYKSGVLNEEQVIDVYEKAMENLENTPCKNDKEKEDVAKVTEDIENIFIQSKVASCENLVALFTPRFEAAPDDIQLVKNIVNMLSKTEEGTDTDLFLNAVNAMNRLEPSYQSAYYLFKLYSSRGNVDEAIKYMDEAIAYPESDDKVDASYNYELAAYSYKNGHSAKAYGCAQKAAELDPEFAGKAYMLIGTIWGSQVCRGNEIESRAPYWVAVDYMIKAKNADETLAAEANSMIAQYSKYYPQKAEAFMYDLLDGQPYTVSCGGMRATTTVRTQN